MSLYAETIAAVRQSWLEAWPRALDAWSKYTQLREPLFFESNSAAVPERMAGDIAAIRLIDQAIMVNLAQVTARHLASMGLPILAHEIGHHVYVPGNLADNARLLAAVSPVLAGLPADIPPLVANLYADLLVNDRLQRLAGVDVVSVYRALRTATSAGTATRAWLVYTRAYEHLWRQSAGSLCPGPTDDEIEADALLVARLVRHYAGNWLKGARRFATVMFPHLRADQDAHQAQTFSNHGLGDTRGAGRGLGDDAEAVPDGLTGVDPSEAGDDDEFDRELDEAIGESRDAPGEGQVNRRGRTGQRPAKARNTAPTSDGRGSTGQCREPFQYGELLKSLGLRLSDHEVTTRYYRERAMPHLVPFPARQAPQQTEPQHEGYEVWEPGLPIEDLDLLQSVIGSPIIVPGVSTVQRVYGDAPGHEPRKAPLDLDIYVDSSGSMPNPSQYISYLALAATIMSLSALRAGARVQATLWSGAGQFETTAGFVRDENQVLGIVTGYISGGTAFPLHVLRETYANRSQADPPAHVMVISDSGIDTMLEKDEQQTSGSVVARAALERARGGGTLALNLHPPWNLQPAFEALGFRVHYVQAWEDLVAFARAFARENYA